jgi:hypothetical protein
MLKFIRKKIQANSFIRRLIGHHLVATGLFDWYFRNYKVSEEWQKRIDLIIECPDNKYIPRVINAGKIIRGKQIMHNNLKINLGSYYGPEIAKVLLLNNGVHEPQEEKVFQEVLKYIPDGATMIEMGSFWSFYSMWFNSKIKNAINFMIEPENFNIESGIRNFKLNNMKGCFIEAFIGEESKLLSDNKKMICIDDFLLNQNIQYVHILHSDIQGFENDMLKGANKTLSSYKVGFIFISTHSEELHINCLKDLDHLNYKIIAEASPLNSFSEDGLIVGRSPSISGIDNISISKRNF